MRLPTLRAWVVAVLSPCLASAQASLPSANDSKTVFIGGVLGLENLIPAGNVAQMLASGKVGLYQHGVGMAQLSASQRRALLATWAPSGVAAGGGGEGVAEAAEAPLGTASRSAGYLDVFGPNGVYPNEVNMNTGTGSGGGTGTWTAAQGDRKPGHVYTGYYTAPDLSLALSSFQEARAHGARNVAAFVSPNDPAQDLDDPFVTSAYWAPVRAMALDGGGLALDVPPNYAFQRPPDYLAMIVQMIQFCRKSGLRSSLTVSPWALVPDVAGHTGNSGFDTGLVDATKRLVEFLAARKALPSQWVVENYSAPVQHGSENAPGLDNTPGTLNEVALYLTHANATQSRYAAP